MNADSAMPRRSAEGQGADIVDDLVFLEAWGSGDVPGLIAFLHVRHIRNGNPVLTGLDDAIKRKKGLLF